VTACGWDPPFGRTVYFCYSSHGVEQDDTVRLCRVSVRKPGEENLALQVERLICAANHGYVNGGVKVGRVGGGLLSIGD
jgi:hypothetical protein